MRALLLLALGCATPLADPTSKVTDPRVLAVAVDPPESVPGADVTLTALYADATGALPDAPVDWSFCHAGRPLAELGPVASRCLEAGGEDLVPVGSGLSVTATLPDDGCSLFGPSAPPAEEGETTGGRPTDPDVTGGFYQPAVGFVDGDPTTLASARLRCGLANVTQDTYVAWNAGYHDNTAPALSGLTADAGAGAVDVPADGAGDAPTVPAGVTVDLAVSWPTCPTEAACGDGVCSGGEDVTACPDDCTAPVACGGAETYVVWNADAGTLDLRREAVSVTWFATDGSLAAARNGRPGDDEATSVDNTWTAPDAPADVWFGVVLRDERGGVSFGGYRLTVE